jgi:hypothetical protein
LRKFEEEPDDCKGEVEGKEEDGEEWWRVCVERCDDAAAR